MARLERSHETSRQGIAAATKKEIADLMDSGQKIGDSKTPFFLKEVRKHIFI